MGRRLFIFSALFVLTAAIACVPVKAVEYGGLGGLPANPDPNNPRTKSIFVYTLSPGERKTDAVQVINNSSETRTVEVYATDSEIASGGSFACTQKADTQQAVGNWLKFEKSLLTLAPNSQQSVAFEVRVPGDASVGEHNGCVVIQGKEAVAEQSGTGVQLSFRSAIRVAITVPGDIKKELEFSSLSVKKEPKKSIITAQIINKGNVSLDTDIQISVKDWLNRTAYRNGGVYPILAQNNPMDFNFEFPRSFWGGLYRVTGTAAYNSDPAAGLGSMGAKNIRKAAPGRWLFVVPNPLALLIMGLVLLAIVASSVFLLFRKRSRKKISGKWQEFIVDRGDTIMGLAKDHGTNWRTIVRVNKLKPPYELKPGSVIKLPVHHKRGR